MSLACAHDVLDVCIVGTRPYVRKRGVISICAWPYGCRSFFFGVVLPQSVRCQLKPRTVPQNFVIQGVVLDFTRAALVGAALKALRHPGAVGVNDDRPERRILPSCESRTIRAPDRR